MVPQTVASLGLLVLLLLGQGSLLATTKKIGYLDYKFNNPIIDEKEVVTNNFKIKPSIKQWDTVDSPKKFAITAMSVDHHSDSSWYMPAFHEKYSIGWNRTTRNSFLTRPYACTIRLSGIGLESTLAPFVTGGTGYLTMGFENEYKKKMWHGFDKNETNRLHCYYSTNKDTGSEFIDSPKTLGVAILCPVILDDEAGGFHFKSNMGQGYFCRPLSDYPAEVEVHLRPSDYSDESKPEAVEATEIIGEVITVPTAARKKQIRELMVIDHRPHAVCTVQTFKNPSSGPMLNLFVKYYQIMGWRVIVYDRFGFHEEFLRDLLDLPGVDYYPFTVHQLTQPTKYNAEFANKQTSVLKTFYKMEKNWGYTSSELADTADQDADKSRTYDHARVEYAHMDTMLYVDADELFFCPQYPAAVESQRKYQQRLMTDFQLQGIEEMRFVRVPYSGMAPPGFINNQENRSAVDFTLNSHHCMLNGYNAKSILKILECWSTGTSFDNFPKSADLASVCPFHYNHWSCDGMKGGGRDFTKKRCRCKVSFDMQNGYEYKPQLKKCHLMHFNDNKYRFQSKRSKHVYDRGDVTVLNPLARLFSGYQDTVKL